jgi:hypothetical protein
MLFVATVMFAPAGWLLPLARALSWPALRYGPKLAGELPRTLVWLELAVAALFVWFLGSAVDLPGASIACAALASLGMGLGLMWLRRGQSARVQALVLAGLVGSFGLWSSLTQSGVRFDFYRRWAGEIARLGEVEHALSLYRQAERYAPPGESRAGKIRELERQLARPRGE